MNIVNGKPYIEKIRKLIAEYTDSLHRDLTFQNLKQELEHLEEKYENGQGKILAALSEEGKVIGCVAYRRLREGLCEMKRLYVKPEFRGKQVGKRLVEEILRLAREDGFQEMVWDTLQPMTAAISLYKTMGFVETEAYYHNPMPDVIYFKKVFR